MRFIVAGALAGLAVGATVGGWAGYQIGAQAAWAIVTRGVRRQRLRQAGD